MSHDSGNGAPVAPSNFLRGIIEADQRSGKYAARVNRQGVVLPSVITRFPPEPNGYLHIGHAKSICLNFGLARDYGGRCHLRFDDTNPTKEEQEYVDTIIDSVEWLGFSWRDTQGEHKYFASDHFDLMYEMAEWLVNAGHAYVDSQSAEEMAANRGSFVEPGKNSRFRDRPAEESLDLLRKMKAGEFKLLGQRLREKSAFGQTRQNPVVERAMILKLQRANRVRNIFDGI